MGRTLAQLPSTPPSTVLPLTSLSHSPGEKGSTEGITAQGQGSLHLRPPHISSPSFSKKSSAFNNFCYLHMLRECRSDHVQVDRCTRDPWDLFSTFSNIFSAPVHLPISSQLLPPLLTSLPGAGNHRSTRCSGCRSIDSQSPAATKHKPAMLCCGLNPTDAQRLAFGQPVLCHAAVGFLPSSEALQASNQYINPLSKQHLLYFLAKYYAILELKIQNTIICRIERIKGSLN